MLRILLVVAVTSFLVGLAVGTMHAQDSFYTGVSLRDVTTAYCEMVQVRDGYKSGHYTVNINGRVVCDVVAHSPR